jgi:hypothetical protein
MKLAQLTFEGIRVNPGNCLMINASVASAAFDLPAKMIDNLNEAGESRRRELGTRERDNDENDG